MFDHVGYSTSCELLNSNRQRLMPPVLVTVDNSIAISERKSSVLRNRLEGSTRSSERKHYWILVSEAVAVF